MASSTTESNVVREWNGDLQVNEGQLGQVVFDSPTASVVLTPSTDYDKLYNKYVIDASGAGGNINVDLPDVNTTNTVVSGKAQKGWSTHIKNNGSSNSLQIRTDTGTNILLLGPGEEVMLIAEADTGAASDWVQLHDSTNLQEAYDASGAVTPKIELDSGLDPDAGFTIQDDTGTPISGNLLQVQDTSGGNLFSVNSSKSVIEGDLQINGSSLSVDPTNVNIGADYLSLLKDYTTSAAARTGGLVVNIDPQAASTTTITSFTAPDTITVADGTVVSSGEIIIVSDPANPDNEGYYEVTGTTATTVTIDTTPTEDFSKSAVITDATAGGNLTNVIVNVIRAKSDGSGWEVGSGNTTPITYSTLSASVTTQQQAYDASVAATDDPIIELSTDTFSIQDNGTTPVTGNIFEIQNTSGTAIFTVDALKTVVEGDLVVNGTTTSIDSETVNIQDNHLYLNNCYETTVPQTGGLVVNYLPTANTTTVAGAAFAAPATINVTSSASFTIGDIIQVCNPANPDNEGIFEVLTIPTGTSLTIDTTPEYDFVQNAIVTDATVQGSVTQVNVSVLRSKSDGSTWELGSGRTNSSGATPVTFTDIPLTMQNTYDNSTNPELVLDSTRGALTIRDNSTPLGANLFEIQDNAGTGDYFEVDATGTTVTGTLDVSGITTLSDAVDIQGSILNIDSTVVNIADNYLKVNSEYTTTTATTGGLVVNYFPVLGGQTSVGGSGFTSATTVDTAVDTSSFIGNMDIILITGANDFRNDGFYEVVGTPTATTITIDPTPVEGFSKTGFVTDSSTAGTIAHVNVSVIRSGTDGDWEVGKDNVVPISYTDLATATSVTLQQAYDNSVTDSSFGLIQLSATTTSREVEIRGSAMDIAETLFTVEDTDASVNYFRVLNNASGNNPAIQGLQGTATGNHSIAIGEGAIANDANAIALGDEARSEGNASFAAGGNLPHATGDGAIALGGSTFASGTGSVAMGASCSATANSAVAIGDSATASAIGALSLGFLSSGGAVSNGTSGSILFGADAGLKLIETSTATSTNRGNWQWETVYLNVVALDATTPQTIYTLSTESNHAYQVRYEILGTRTSGSGSAGDSWSYTGIFKAKNISATTTKLDGPQTIIQDTVGTAVTTTISGTDVLLQVTGLAGHVIDWILNIEYQEHGF